MTTTNLCLLIPTFLVLSLNSTTATADNPYEQVQKISKLADESEKSALKCDSFFQKIQTLDPSYKEYFSDPKIALQVLENAKDYSGTPAPTQAAFGALLKYDENDLPTGSLAGDLRAAVARLSDCRSIDYYALLNRLLESRKRGSFSQEANTALRTLILKYLVHESSAVTSLTQVKLMIELLSLSVKEELIFPTVDQRKSLESLQKLLKQSEPNEAKHLAELEAGMSEVAAKKNINEMGANHKALIQILWEIKESQKLRFPLMDILTSINANS